MALLPQPERHRDWQAWARALLTRLETPEQQKLLFSSTMTVAEITLIKPIAGLGPILATDETGGAVLVYADGTNWRRTTDRAIMA